MNPSPARLALSCLALTTLGLGLGACGDSTAHTPPPTAGPSNPNAAAAVTAKMAAPDFRSVASADANVTTGPSSGRVTLREFPWYVSSRSRPSSTGVTAETVAFVNGRGNQLKCLPEIGLRFEI